MTRTSYIGSLLLLLAIVVATTGLPHAKPGVRRDLVCDKTYQDGWLCDLYGPFLKSVVCIPTALRTLEDHEGRHPCAYDHSKGFRAVGVGYNLDDDVDTRKSEVSKLLLDYDKVYSGDSCLWDIQINTLATLDVRRALVKAAEAVEPLDDFCCELQAVFADIQHSIGESKSLSGKDLRDVVEKASKEDWTSAADELQKTDWCEDNKLRCKDNVDVVKTGCEERKTVA